MDTLKLYVSLSQLGLYTGVGALLGAILGGGDSNTPYWIGAIMIIVGAVFLGMSIATKRDQPTKHDEQ